jgi:beta-lactamase regulating signal transducer with metallopeptidase domain
MLWWLAQNALMAGLLAGLVTLVCWLGQFRPAVRHGLWLIVMLRFVTPPGIVWPWALPGMAAPVASANTVPPKEQPLTMQFEQEVVVIFDEPPASEQSLPRIRPKIEPDAEPAALNRVRCAAWMSGEWLGPLLYNLWLAGTGIVLLMQTIRVARFQRLLARAGPAPRWLDKLVAEVAGKLRLRPPPTLILTGIGSPSVWALGRPKLLWPASLLKSLPRNCQRGIVAHELAHLRRRDHWVSWLQLAADCVCWWNPLFWYVRRQLRFNAELACDAWVVSTLPEERRAYAEALIEVTQLISQTAAPLPALGMSSAARHDFERRLTMIMRDRVPCRVPLVGLLAIGVLAFISLPGWSQQEVQVRTVQVQEAPDVKEGPAPEKRDIILRIQSDVDWQDAKPSLGLVQKTADGQKVILETKVDSVSDRERRLERLEGQLQDLIKEVQALRSGGPRPQTTTKTPPATKTDQPSDRVRIIERTPVWYSDTVKPQVEKVTGTVRTLYDGKETVTVMNLSRATYKMARARAEILATLLSQHEKGHILEARVDGDSLIVTTTPEALGVITQFVALLEGATAALSKDAKTGRVMEVWRTGPDSPDEQFRYRIVEPDGSPKKPSWGDKKDPLKP